MAGWRSRPKFSKSAGLVHKIGWPRYGGSIRIGRIWQGSLQTSPADLGHHHWLAREGWGGWGPTNPTARSFDKEDGDDDIRSQAAQGMQSIISELARDLGDQSRAKRVPTRGRARRSAWQRTSSEDVTALLLVWSNLPWLLPTLPWATCLTTMARYDNSSWRVSIGLD